MTDCGEYKQDWVKADSPEEEQMITKYEIQGWELEHRTQEPGTNQVRLVFRKR
jgi:hypothetical protein